MKFKFSILAVAATWALTSCTTGEVATNTTSQQSNVTKEIDPDKVIVCKQRRSTGTRIPEKQCMTKGAWDRIAEASQQTRDKLNKPAYNRVNED